MLAKRVLLFMLLMGSISVVYAQQHYVDLTATKDKEPLKTFKHRISGRAMPVMRVFDDRIYGNDAEIYSYASYYLGVEMAYEYRVNKKFGFSVPAGLLIEPAPKGSKPSIYIAYIGIATQPYLYNNNRFSMFMQFESGYGMGLLGGSRHGLYMNMTWLGFNMHSRRSDRVIFTVKMLDWGLYIGIDPPYNGKFSANVRFLSLGINLGLGKSTLVE